MDLNILATIKRITWINMLGSIPHQKFSFYSVWTLFDILFLRNKKHATDRNWHWALDQYVSPKNNIKSCQKYMKVE